jgi:hypothetical protein
MLRYEELAKIRLRVYWLEMLQTPIALLIHYLNDRLSF